VSTVIWMHLSAGVTTLRRAISAFRARLPYVTLLLPLVSLTAAAILTGEVVTIPVVAGGIVILAGVYLGAFLKIRPHRTSASALPECLPIDACREAEPPAPTPAPAPAPARAG